MSQVQVEGVGTAVVEESEFGATTPPTTGWSNLDVNSLSGVGSQMKKTPRDPISKNLQLRKGMLTGMDSGISFEHDVTKDLLDVFGGAIYRCAPKHSGGTAQSLFRPTAVTATGYTVPAAGDLQQRTLVFARGFANAANNGLKLVAAASTTTEIKTSGLVVESSPPAGATVEVAGFRFVAGDAVMTAAGNITVSAANFTTMGLNVEQWVVVGGRQDNALFSFDNLFYQGAAKIETIASGQLTLSRRTWDVFADFVFTADAGTDLATKTAHGLETGFGPIRVSNSGGALPTGLVAGTDYWIINISANTFKFAASYANAIAGTPIDLTTNGTGTQTLHTADNGVGQELEVYFSRWYRNVPIDHSDYRTPSFAFEITYPELMAGSPGYEYPIGNVLDEAVWNFPLEDKATMSLTFVGTRCLNPTASRKTGPSTALDPTTDSGVSTATDLQRLRVTGTDELGISTDFQSLKITDKNNVSPQKQLAALGARLMNQGKHTVAVEADVIFTDSEVIEAVRDNRDACLDILMRNEDFGALLDVQKMTVDSVDRKFERDKTVTLDTKAMGNQDGLSTDSLSVFAWLPELPEDES